MCDGIDDGYSEGTPMPKIIGVDPGSPKGDRSGGSVIVGGIGSGSRNMALPQIMAGSPYPDLDPTIVKKSLSSTFNNSFFLNKWELPTGAVGENAGPT